MTTDQSTYRTLTLTRPQTRISQGLTLLTPQQMRNVEYLLVRNVVHLAPPSHHLQTLPGYPSPNMYWSAVVDRGVVYYLAADEKALRAATDRCVACDAAPGQKCHMDCAVLQAEEQNWTLPAMARVDADGFIQWPLAEIVNFPALDAELAERAMMAWEIIQDAGTYKPLFREALLPDTTQLGDATVRTWVPGQGTHGTNTGFQHVLDAFGTQITLEYDERGVIVVRVETDGPARIEIDGTVAR